MSHDKIQDFTETGPWTVRNTLKVRYGKKVEPRLADTEVMLGDAGGVTCCPTLFWSAKAANFAVVKPGAKRCRTYFYYHPEHRLGIGIDSHDEIGDCLIRVLQVETDHMRQQKISMDQKPAKDDGTAPDRIHHHSSGEANQLYGKAET